MVLVEREDALATLAASISDAAAGEGRLVLISGEAGAGKTSLIRAAAAWVGPGCCGETATGCSPLARSVRCWTR